MKGGGAGSEGAVTKISSETVHHFCGREGEKLGGYGRASGSGDEARDELGDAGGVAAVARKLMWTVEPLEAAAST